MNKSDTIAALAAAMAKAQAEIEGAAKDKVNPHFRSKYADLGNVVDAIKPALAKHGLSFIQVSHDCEAAAKVETVILHSSGEWLSCGAVSVPVTKNDAQGFGSALTYARRYSLAAAFGVAPEDDDGNAASANAPKKKAGMSENSITDYVDAISMAVDLSDLKAAYAAAYKAAQAENDGSAVKRFESAKNERKAVLERSAA